VRTQEEELIKELERNEQELNDKEMKLRESVKEK
jgi:hypothetical protein